MLEYTIVQKIRESMKSLPPLLLLRYCEVLITPVGPTVDPSFCTMTEFNLSFTPRATEENCSCMEKEQQGKCTFGEMRAQSIYNQGLINLGHV